MHQEKVTMLNLRLFIVCLLLALAGCGSTQYVDCEVEVRNFETHEPIHNARVTLYWKEDMQGGRAHTLVMDSGETDEGGGVLFEKLPEGVWEVQVRVPGYRYQSAWVVLQRPEEEGVWGSRGWVPCRFDLGSPSRGSEVVEILAAVQAVERLSRNEVLGQ